MDQQFSTSYFGNGLEAITPVHFAEAELGFIFTVYSPVLSSVLPNVV